MEPRRNATQELSAAAARLERARTDLGAWLGLAWALAAAGRRGEAAEGFYALGEAANRCGQVALAIGCARWLDEAMRHEEAQALIASVARSHGRGSARADAECAAPAAPPGAIATPGSADLSPAPAVTLDEAVAKARSVLEAAASATSRVAPAVLPPSPIVAGLDAEELAELASVICPSRWRAGQAVVSLGEPAKSLYWIAAGRLRAVRRERDLGELGSGAIFGEIALVGGTTRTAQVICLQDAWLLEMPVDAIAELAVRAPHLAGVLAQYARERLLANLMRTSELFSRLDRRAREELIGRFCPRFVAAGTRIIRKGADNDTLFVVVSGQCEVRDGGRAIATLGIGAGAGEMSLLAGKPAMADFVATEDSVFLTLQRSDFDELAAKQPGLRGEVSKLLVERERDQRDLLVCAAEVLIL